MTRTGQGRREAGRHPENPLESLVRCVASNSRDWSVDSRDAWLYGIICGWGDGEAMPEVAESFGWDAEAVARLRRLHERFSLLSEQEDARVLCEENPSLVEP